MHLLVFELLPPGTGEILVGLGLCGPGLANLWGLGMQRGIGSGGEIALQCETNHPLLRQLSIPPCARGQNSALAVHLPALLLGLVQVAKGTQWCSFSAAFLCCRKGQEESREGETCVSPKCSLILQCLEEAFFSTGHPECGQGCSCRRGSVQ